MRIGIAINPTSGRGRGSAFGDEARAVLAEYPVDIVELSGDDADACLRACHAAVHAGDIDALLAVGGDGMVHLGVNAVAGTHIPLGIIAVGSGNDIAREFHLPIRHVRNSVNQVMACLFGGRQRPTDVIQIDGAHGRSYALAVLSAGIDAEVNLVTNSLNWPKGNMRYLRGVAQCLRDYRLYGVNLQIDGVAASGPVTLVSVANCRFMGGGMNIAPGAQTNDGLLDVVIGYAPKPITLAGLLPLVYVGRHTSSPVVHMKRGSRIRLEEDLSVGGPTPIAMADGEVVGPFPLDIRCLSGGLDLLI